MTIDQAIATWNRVEANHPAIHGGFVWQIHTDEAQGWVFLTRVGPLIMQYVFWKPAKPRPGGAPWPGQPEPHRATG